MSNKSEGITEQKRMLLLLDYITQRLSIVSRRIAKICLCGIIAVTVVDVFLRYFFNAPIFGSADIVKLLEGAVLAFSLLCTHIMGGNITIDIIVERFSKRSQHIIHSINLVISFCFFLFLGYISAEHGIAMFRAGEVTMALAIPVYPVLFVISFGCFVLCPRIIVELAQSIQNFNQEKRK